MGGPGTRLSAAHFHPTRAPALAPRNSPNCQSELNKETVSFTFFATFDHIIDSKHLTLERHFLRRWLCLHQIKDCGAWRHRQDAVYKIVSLIM